MLFADPAACGAAGQRHAGLGTGQAQLVPRDLAAEALAGQQVQDIAQLDRMGEKSAANAVAAIEKSKENDLWRLLSALGIRQVGDKAAKVLAAHVGSFDALSAASEEEQTAIDDVGPITARYIRQWLESPQSQDLLARLREAGVNMTSHQEKVDDRFAGQTFVLTGTLEKFTRDEAAAMIEQRHYELVLLHVMLPDYDGYELIDYIRQYDTPVIFVTARAEILDRVKGLRAGAEDYIVKPCDLRELTARVENVLRRYR